MIRTPTIPSARPTVLSHLHLKILLIRCLRFAIGPTCPYGASRARKGAACAATGFDVKRLSQIATECREWAGKRALPSDFYRRGLCPETAAASN